MYETDKIAVLMASYNGERFIGEQIDSLLTQSCTEWELLIHDDGSQDRTQQIIDVYARNNPTRIHVVPGLPCGGAKNNFFFLMKQVRAPYIMFCDQDDIWKREKIEKTISRMKEMEEQNGPETPILVFTDLSVVDGELNPIADRLSVYQKLFPDRTQLENLMIQNVISGCTMMINRPLADLAVKPENADNIIMHDWWCALVAASFGRISFVNLPLMLYRQHENNTLGAKKLESAHYILERLQNQREIKLSLVATQKQIALFAETYGLSDPVLKEYGKLYKRNKLQRLFFYRKHHIRKCGWKRNLGLLIWG